MNNYELNEMVAWAAAIGKHMYKMTLEEMEKFKLGVNDAMDVYIEMYHKNKVELDYLKKCSACNVCENKDKIPGHDSPCPIHDACEISDHHEPKTAI